MQAIILAAGPGTRFVPFSLTKPKPMFSVFGKSILEHNLGALAGIAHEVFIVVGYKQEQIRERIGNEYQGIKINYLEQSEPVGTGAAAKLADEYLEDRFLLLNGDDYYFQEDIEKAVNNFPCVLVKEHENPSAFGVISVSGEKVAGLVEKPENPPTNLVNTGLYCLPKNIFELEIGKSSRGEYEFTDYLKQFLEKKELHFAVAENWFPASYPWEALNALPALWNELKKINQGTVEPGAQIKGELILGEGSIVKSGAYLEGMVYVGKNCVIGPNCFIRGSVSIGNNCHIGNAVEIKNSIVGNNTNVAHLSYVGDSIIGDNCNLAAGVITANLRHDGASVKTKVKGVLIDTQRTKFGALIGDNVKIGIGTLIDPGRKIWPDKMTLPGAIVDEDIE